MSEHINFYPAYVVLLKIEALVDAMILKLDNMEKENETTRT